MRTFKLPQCHDRFRTTVRTTCNNSSLDSDSLFCSWAAHFPPKYVVFTFGLIHWTLSPALETNIYQLISFIYMSKVHTNKNPVGNPEASKYSEDRDDNYRRNQRDDTELLNMNFKIYKAVLGANYVLLELERLPTDSQAHLKLLDETRVYSCR